MNKFSMPRDGIREILAGHKRQIRNSTREWNIGDVIFVPEGYRVRKDEGNESGLFVQYETDEKEYYFPNLEVQKNGSNTGFQNPATMPQALARLYLVITGMWAENLQDITGNDLDAEGVRVVYAESPYKDEQIIRREMFYVGWDTEMKRRGFGDDMLSKNNPTVYVYEFKPLVFIDTKGVR